MKTEIEQIHAIFEGDTFHWAINQLLPNENIDNKRYSDFISVHFDDIEEYIRENGFPSGTIEEVEKGQSPLRDDCLCMEEKTNGWEVYYIERGKRSEQKVFQSLFEARREVIRRMIASAKIVLNHRYRNAHPEMNLPRPSEMD
jgi:hypothetical protein